MTYSIHWFDEAQTTFQYLKLGVLSIPLDPANRHYQEVLDDIILEGAACFDGDIPADLQAAADAKLASGAYNANKP
tara:strand:- start:26 stop:253 length:228 start_codon:yes stop_codon:yes gene_type:complete